MHCTHQTHIKHTWASEDSVQTECRVSHCFSEVLFKWCCFGYVGLTEMYQIQLLFFKLTAKHLGLMPVVHISPSAAQTQVGAPSLVHTLPTLTSGHGILKKS